MATYYPGPVRVSGDLLVDILLAVVAGSTVTQLDEIFHASYSRVGTDKVLVRWDSDDTPLIRPDKGASSIPDVVFLWILKKNS
jgi:hypothetical protein